MSILSFLFWGAASLGLMARDEIKTTRNINRNVAQMQADGSFRDVNYDLEFELRRKAMIDWEYGDKAMYPKYLWEFLEKYGAAEKYAEGIAARQVISAGYRPMMSSVPFPVARYDPFAGYKNIFGPYEEEFLKNKKAAKDRGFPLYKCDRCDIVWDPKDKGEICPRCQCMTYMEC